MPDAVHAVDDRVALEVYPVALSQARGHVMLQLAAICAVVAFWMVLGFPRQHAWTVSWMTVGLVATAYDIRWWLWLRRANPIDAYARLQARTGREGEPLRSHLTLVATIGLFALWWFLGR